MDFNSGNRQNGKRRAQSIQEMINSSPAGGSGIRKSGYSGPKNAKSAIANTSDLSGINVNRSDSFERWGNSNEGMPKPKKQRYKADVANPMRGNFLKRDIEQSRQRLDRKSKEIKKEKMKREVMSDMGALPGVGYVAPKSRGPLDSYGWIIYTCMLMLCVLVTLIASGVKPRSSGYTYPMNVITISGVINTAYEQAMGIKGTFSTTDSFNAADSSDGSDITASQTDGTKQVEVPDASNLNDLGDEGEAATLDDGTMSIPGVSQATSHEELVSQIQSALSSGNYSFVACKIAYEDEATGMPDAYPMSQIKHFCEYMYNNPDKITAFISNISSEEYSAKNKNAYIVKLPLMKFTVKMGTGSDNFVLDNTVVSVSGFSDVIVNSNQNAAIYPLLPCMYTVTLTNNAWDPASQSQEIEATLGEGNLEIGVGQSSE